MRSHPQARFFSASAALRARVLRRAPRLQSSAQVDAGLVFGWGTVDAAILACPRGLAPGLAITTIAAMRVHPQARFFWAGAARRARVLRRAPRLQSSAHVEAG